MAVLWSQSHGKNLWRLNAEQRPSLTSHPIHLLLLVIGPSHIKRHLKSLLTSPRSSDLPAWMGQTFLENSLHVMHLKLVDKEPQSLTHELSVCPGGAGVSQQREMTLNLLEG